MIRDHVKILRPIGPDREALERDGLGGPTHEDWVRLHRARELQARSEAELSRPAAHDLWIAGILAALATIVVMLRLL